MGKTSIVSRLNLPGRLGWVTMELPGVLTLLYTLFALSPAHDPRNLPWQARAMAAMFATHYAHRAVAAPLFLNPSMAPIHVLVWAAAACFQVLNGVGVGGWLARYGEGARGEYWDARSTAALGVGAALWAAGLLGNWYHDEALRALRRPRVARDAEGKEVVEQPPRYSVPEAGLFRWVLYAHYSTEWVEWIGFWVFGGLRACGPARTFVVNEVASMLPRAVNGKKWYVEKFGEERVGGRWAVIPGIV
jgi:3-oxo-5-alpha-steroid 4-dehydrogenase 1